MCVGGGVPTMVGVRGHFRPAGSVLAFEIKVRLSGLVVGTLTLINILLVPTLYL